MSVEHFNAYLELIDGLAHLRASRARMSTEMYNAILDVLGQLGKNIQRVNFHLTDDEVKSVTANSVAAMDRFEEMFPGAVDFTKLKELLSE